MRNEFEKMSGFRLTFETKMHCYLQVLTMMLTLSKLSILIYILQMVHTNPMLEGAPLLIEFTVNHLSLKLIFQNVKVNKYMLNYIYNNDIVKTSCSLNIF